MHSKLILLSLFLTFTAWGQSRKEISLQANWQSTATDDTTAHPDFYRSEFKPQSWKTVQVPHNWDQYGGYRRKVNGNRYGVAWYRKTFTVQETAAGKRFFLFFEGVGSYATLWLNGKKIGYHAGGRTSFTLDITDVIRLNNQTNLLAVRADHPDQIQDLPWVSGGSSSERGFSEGSQPMGIFRPVQLIVTRDVRIEPFGVHVWNDTSVSATAAKLHVTSEIKNYGTRPRTLTVVQQLLDRSGKTVTKVEQKLNLKAGETVTLASPDLSVSRPQLWSPEQPYLYRLVTQVLEQGQRMDQLTTPYGIRRVSWDLSPNAKTRLRINGQPVFINGVAEYEHLLGNSHAFSEEQIHTRVRQVKAVGFNAFRDAHQPHNLRYHLYWDEAGILWWPQMAAHIWYDTPAFRQNFKRLLIDWVKERRNSPSIILWGLENESTLPEDFARECSELIRQLDPTASSQRKITTCNGGKGTDWDVPQNWTGTYGGDPQQYGEDLKRQILVGEYGAWRTIDQHTEGRGVFSENRMTDLMETKIRLAESVRDRTAGHFFWLLNSHDNPGRVQGGEGLRELDRIGPVNYKGLFTAWEEPTDAFYLFRSNYAPKETEPMVYIVSHTWPNRWTTPGRKDSLIVYSNCDAVELFNDVNHRSLGRKTRQGVGTHFQWDGADIQTNTLYAVGYVKGKAVATDVVVLNHLPEAPHLSEVTGKVTAASTSGLRYLYRVNCGGPTYTDVQKKVWYADQRKTETNAWGSTSWTEHYPGMPAFFASQRRTFDPIRGTSDPKLFQTFRYGRDQLAYHFNVPDGDYQVELYFIEPWYGTGGGLDATGWRLFDVAINDEVRLKNLDIWKEVGHDALLKKTLRVRVRGGQLKVSFPHVPSAQAVISAIAIAALDTKSVITQQSSSILKSTQGSVESWLDTGDGLFADETTRAVSLPSHLYGATWLKRKRNEAATVQVTEAADVFLAVPASALPPSGFEATDTFLTTDEPRQYSLVRKRMQANEKLMAAAGSWLAALPVYTLEPAYDLKAATSYKATQAQPIGQGVGKEVFLDKERMVFKKASGDTLEWILAVGVADTYSLTLKYHNPAQKALKVSVELILKDGTVVKPAETLELEPSKPGKWTYATTNTGTMINAGTYTLRLKTLDADRLYLDTLDVQ
ncbi:glycoside hydrolase family 2 [Siphonobacter sp. BAB-5385]|uniref:malectin domain-containing carbohydrate-binding protein n=1 Tax=Siphonobacter sp. BAB-5385 TaxID=1864822 RepID=UPI000B9ED5B6|nr:malectin domain-containing carbohydrate-binding protein [Siphonobacter sp. BAB-5385]OZI09539.1 glycoside hydrolase family 2 [Siphonobacter sp. BAB-5385]